MKNNNNKKEVHSNRCEPSIFGMDMDIKDDFIDPFTNIEQRMYKDFKNPLSDIAILPKKTNTQELNQKNNPKDKPKKTVHIFPKYIAVLIIIQMDNHIKNVIKLKALNK